MRSLKSENILFQARGRRWDAQRRAWLPSRAKVVDFGGTRHLCPVNGTLLPGQCPLQCAPAPCLSCSSSSKAVTSAQHSSTLRRAASYSASARREQRTV